MGRNSGSIPQSTIFFSFILFVHHASGLLNFVLEQVRRPVKSSPGSGSRRRCALLEEVKNHEDDVISNDPLRLSI